MAGEAEIDEAADLLEMLKKIEINFFTLYEKRVKVEKAPKKDQEKVKEIEKDLKMVRQAEKMAKKQEDAVKKTEQLKNEQDAKSKAREKS